VAQGITWQGPESADLYMHIFSDPYLFIRSPGFNHGDTTLITLSNPNHLPKVQATNTIVGLIFHPFFGEGG
jgi:hypothetical protein